LYSSFVPKRICHKQTVLESIGDAVHVENMTPHIARHTAKVSADAIYDCDIFREGLRALLKTEPGLEWVGEAIDIR
jgi:hypothetical protein